jgi:hypothetical protein
MTPDPKTVSVEQLTAWADTCLSINHLGTLVQRELQAKSYARAAELSERSRQRAWALFNELLAHGAVKRAGFAEPGSGPSP